MKKISLKLLSFLLSFGVICSATQVFASPADINTNFNTGVPVGFDFYIRNSALQNDGKTIVVGPFSSYKGFPVKGGIIRINADGSRDTSFNIPDGITAGQGIALQANGKILIAGTSAGIVRLNANGSIDPSFNTGAGFTNGGIMSIAVQSDGKIIAGGDFTTYQGVSANKIVRINANGSIDTGFNAGVGFNNYVRTVLAQPNGKILVLGEFSSYQGNATPSKIISLNSDGSIDSSLNLGAAFNNRVTAAAVQSDGKIIALGRFGTYKGSTANNIIRINTDGTIDTTFLCGGGAVQPDTNIYNIWSPHLTIQSDDKILVMGTFSTNSGVRYGSYGDSVSGFKRLNSDGSIDTGFVFPNIRDADGSSPLQILVNTSGKIVMLGNFKTYNGIAVNGIISFNSDGSKDTSFDVGNAFGDTVRTTSVLPDGKVIVGGRFVSYNGFSANGLIKLNVDGTKDSSFDIGTGLDKSGPATITATLAQPDGKILVGGDFYSYRGFNSYDLVRINTDGTPDTSFNVGYGPSSLVYAIALQSDGKVLIGGDFGTFNDTVSPYIARLNSDGSIDTGFDVGTGWEGGFYLNGNEMVRSIVIQPDGKILVGGKFSAYKTIPANNIIRLNADGSRDNSFNIGNGLQGGSYDGQVQSIALQADGKILVGGYFETYKGVSANKIIRLNSDGSRDNSFNIGNGFDGYVNDIIVANGKIAVGGEFSSYKGVFANNIIRLNTDGSRDNSFVVGSGFGAAVYSLSKQINDNIIVGGSFQSYKGVAAGRLTTLYGDATTVLLPNSTETTTVNTVFTNNGYVETSGVLAGSTPISLAITDGIIPTTLNILNENISLFIDKNTQVQDNNAVNYSGIFSVPINKSIVSVNDELTVAAFNVGSISQALSINGGAATFSVPTPSLNIGDNVNIYYSQDNGVSWYPETLAKAEGKDGQVVVSFATSHFGDFAITIPTYGIDWNFQINSGAIETNSLNVNLNIYILPNAYQMRFSNDGLNRSNWEPYSNTKSWTLSGTRNTQVVYAQFDTNDDNINEVTVNDSIALNVIDSTPPPSNGGGSNGGGNSSSSSNSYSSNIIPTVIDEINTLLHGSAGHESGSILGSTYSTELNNAYLWAFGFDITTMNTIQKANMEGKLIRKDMAKMISNFAINVLKRTPSTDTTCTFSDTKGLTEEAKSYISLSCKLGLMGLESNGTTVKKSFDPLSEVDRGQFGTILSRLLRANKYNGGNPYYAKHLNALKTAGIMTKITTPLQKEIRGYVMLMMMRATAK